MPREAKKKTTEGKKPAADVKKTATLNPDNPNYEISKKLLEMAESEKQAGGNVFGSNAIRKAAFSINDYPTKLKNGKEATQIQGIGKGVADRIDRILNENNDDSENSVCSPQRYGNDQSDDEADYNDRRDADDLQSDEADYDEEERKKIKSQKGYKPQEDVVDYESNNFRQRGNDRENSAHEDNKYKNISLEDDLDSADELSELEHSDLQPIRLVYEPEVEIDKKARTTSKKSNKKKAKDTEVDEVVQEEEEEEAIANAVALETTKKTVEKNVKKKKQQKEMESEEAPPRDQEEHLSLVAENDKKKKTKGMNKKKNDDINEEIAVVAAAETGKKETKKKLKNVTNETNEITEQTHPTQEKEKKTKKQIENAAIGGKETENKKAVEKEKKNQVKENNENENQADPKPIKGRKKKILTEEKENDKPVMKNVTHGKDDVDDLIDSMAKTSISTSKYNLRSREKKKNIF